VLVILLGLPGGFKANPLPVVGFILPEVCLNDATATFTDTSSIADGTEAGFNYLWKFDDGVSTVDPTKRPVPLTASTSLNLLRPVIKHLETIRSLYKLLQVMVVLPLIINHLR
jgi:hypothetical protein